MGEPGDVWLHYEFLHRRQRHADIRPSEQPAAGIGNHNLALPGDVVFPVNLIAQWVVAGA